MKPMKGKIAMDCFSDKFTDNEKKLITLLRKNKEAISLALVLLRPPALPPVKKDLPPDKE